jgi:hypothetical protein
MAKKTLDCVYCTEYKAEFVMHSDVSSKGIPVCGMEAGMLLQEMLSKAREVCVRAV